MNTKIENGVLLEVTDAGKKWIIPTGVTVVGKDTGDGTNGSFSNCLDLEELILPEGVEYIEFGAFYGCENLHTLVLPSTLSTIADYAFAQCKNLKNVVIPRNVGTIGAGFCGVHALSTFTIEDGNPYFCMDGACLIENETKTVLAGCAESVIPAYINIIQEDSFAGSAIKSVRIPESVTTIEDYAFFGCEELASVSIPASVTSIYDESFAECPLLTIYGESGSTAEQYAKDNDIPFQTI